MNSAIALILQNSYLAVSRQLKRMVSITRSPMNSSLTESYSGAATIRAYSMEDNFIEENAYRVEANQKCYYPEVASNSWLFSRLEMLANLVSEQYQINCYSTRGIKNDYTRRFFF